MNEAVNKSKLILVHL